MAGGVGRYAAPAAFLLAVTIAVVLVRSGMDAGQDNPVAATATAPTQTHESVARHTRTTTTTKKKPAAHHSAAARQYWTVAAGDTYGVISSKTGVPVATLEQLNPGVSTTALYIGEKIRIK
jgi:LysM repeat protein